jgi:hypothetical protein
MTTENNAFNQSQATPESVPASPSAFADQLSMIKNETGEQKYNDIPKALDALAHSQSYIPQLKSENETQSAEIARLTEELSKRSSVEDVVSKLTAQQAPAETTPQVSGLDEQGVTDLFNTLSTEQQATQIASSNEKSVSDTLFSKFGDKTVDVVASKAAELGMSVEGLRALSQNSPQAALQLFQAQGVSAPSVTQGSYNIPPNSVQADVLQPPEKSLLRGASTKDQMAYLDTVRARVYKKHNVEI